MQIISLKKVTVEFDGRVALENITFEVKKGEYVGLIGPNGAGKSTLLKTIVGVIKKTSGDIKVQKGLRMGYVPQHFLPDGNMNISVE